MTTRWRTGWTTRLLGAVLGAFAASCAGVAYRSIPQEPCFREPIGRLAALDAEIADVQRRITANDASDPQDDAGRQAKEATKQALAAELDRLRGKRPSVEAEQHLATQNGEAIRNKNAEIRAANAREERGPLLGLRFYSPSPYLLVYSDGKGGVVWEIHHLPDPTKKMSAKPYNYLSTLEAKLTFDDNFVLTGTHEVSDALKVPTAILSQIAALAPTIAKALLNEASTKERTLPAPLLYKIVDENGSVRLLGGETDPDVVHVTVLSTTPAAKSEPKPQGGNQ